MATTFHGEAVDGRGNTRRGFSATTTVSRLDYQDLISFRCAHRGTQLSVGWVEGDSIRCRYHGWKYDATGLCTEQPWEDAAFASRVKIQSYPTHEYLGLVFAYLGAGEPPPLKRYPDFERPGVLEVGSPEYWPCNYFNRLDNACDIGHAGTHRASIERTHKAAEYAIPVLHCEETPYGIRTAVEQAHDLLPFPHAQREPGAGALPGRRLPRGCPEPLGRRAVLARPY